MYKVIIWRHTQLHSTCYTLWAFLFFLIFFFLCHNNHARNLWLVNKDSNYIDAWFDHFLLVSTIQYVLHNLSKLNPMRPHAKAFKYKGPHKRNETAWQRLLIDKIALVFRAELNPKHELMHANLRLKMVLDEIPIWIYSPYYGSFLNIRVRHVL